MSAEYSQSVRRTVQAPLGLTYTLQSGATATGNGSSATPKSSKCLLVVSGITTATVKVEVSADGGTTWVQHGSDITANGTVVLDTVLPLVRARVSAYTSGTIIATLCE